jgi:hypothetical protein
MKTFENFINEKLSAKKPNETETIEVDMSYDEDEKADVTAVWKKFKLTVKEIKGGQGTEHEVTGKKKDILAYLQSEYYEMDDESIEEYYPELLEGNILDEGMVQIAGSNKPSGARVLATLIVEELEKNGFINLNKNDKTGRNLIDALVAKTIMDNTF